MRLLCTKEDLGIAGLVLLCAVYQVFKEYFFGAPRVRQDSIWGDPFIVEVFGQAKPAIASAFQKPHALGGNSGRSDGEVCEVSDVSLVTGLLDVYRTRISTLSVPELAIIEQRDEIRPRFSVDADHGLRN